MKGLLILLALMRLLPAAWADGMICTPRGCFDVGGTIRGAVSQGSVTVTLGPGSSLFEEKLFFQDGALTGGGKVFRGVKSRVRVTPPLPVFSTDRGSAELSETTLKRGKTLQVKKKATFTSTAFGGWRVVRIVRVSEDGSRFGVAEMVFTRDRKLVGLFSIGGNSKRLILSGVWRLSGAGFVKDRMREIWQQAEREGMSPTVTRALHVLALEIVARTKGNTLPRKGET